MNGAYIIVPEPEQAIHDFIDIAREALSDAKYLFIFLLFVFVGVHVLSERAMFYILLVILFSILIVNADRIQRAINMIFP